MQPKFELPDYQAHNVDEDIPIETSILKVKASDADSGSNAEIEYLVSDEHFSIDTNGVIRNAKQLDADNNNAYYEFVVTARDKGIYYYYFNFPIHNKIYIKYTLGSGQSESRCTYANGTVMLRMNYYATCFRRPCPNWNCDCSNLHQK